MVPPIQDGRLNDIHFMEEVRIKLAKKWAIPEWSIQEQIDCFKSAFPDSEEEMDDGIKENK